MKWKEIVEEINKGVINEENEIVVYDKETGEEFDCDLIEFEDTGEIQLIINEDCE